MGAKGRANGSLPLVFLCPRDVAANCLARTSDCETGFAMANGPSIMAAEFARPLLLDSGTREEDCFGQIVLLE